MASNRKALSDLLNKPAIRRSQIRKHLRICHPNRRCEATSRRSEGTKFASTCQFAHPSQRPEGTKYASTCVFAQPSRESEATKSASTCRFAHPNRRPEGTKLASTCVFDMPCLNCSLLLAKAGGDPFDRLRAGACPTTEEYVQTTGEKDARRAAVRSNRKALSDLSSRASDTANQIRKHLRICPSKTTTRRDQKGKHFPFCPAKAGDPNDQIRNHLWKFFHK